jgi:hypothetical protein
MTPTRKNMPMETEQKARTGPTVDSATKLLEDATNIPSDSPMKVLPKSNMTRDVA